MRDLCNVMYARESVFQTSPPFSSARADLYGIVLIDLTPRLSRGVRAAAREMSFGVEGFFLKDFFFFNEEILFLSRVI